VTEHRERGWNGIASMAKPAFFWYRTKQQVA